MQHACLPIDFMATKVYLKRKSGKVGLGLTSFCFNYELDVTLALVRDLG